MKLEIFTDNMIKAFIEAGAPDWSDQRKRQFSESWKSLEAAGAEMIDVRIMPGSRIAAYPSEDFTAHCRAHGVSIGQ